METYSTQKTAQSNQKPEKKSKATAQQSTKSSGRSPKGNSKERLTTDSTYDKLTNFVDAFGSRWTGRENLDKTIDYFLEKSKEFHLENVHGEEFHFTNWIRGEESAFMIEPRLQKLHMLSDARSLGTNGSEIRAEAIVFDSYEEMRRRSGEIKGRIAVFNLHYKDYFKEFKESNDQFVRGMVHGAVAVLSRSVASFSLNTPHTGNMVYTKSVDSNYLNITEVPCAEISVEDAMMLSRIQKRGQKIIISLKMEAKDVKDVSSRNAVAEIKGRERPDEIVIISGHIDSYDVGVGAVDDGCGLFLSWNSAVILKALGLIPKRTLRVVAWSAEELGLEGAEEYVKTSSSSGVVLAMESDYGVFNPLGLDFGGSIGGACIINEIVQLFKPLNATKIHHLKNEVGSDISVFQNIPTVELYSSNENYFHYQHSEGDTMNSLDSGEMDRATALWASAAYILADMNKDRVLFY